MKHAMSISLGSSERDKRVTVVFKGEEVIIERIGTDGDIPKLKQLFRDFDGKVDAFGIGGVDLYVRLEKKEYPLYAAINLVKEVTKTPIVDGRGLKHTLEKRIFQLIRPLLEEPLLFKQAFVPVAIDRVGLAEAASEVAERVVFGDLMIALNIPIPIWGLRNYLRIARLLMPFVSHFPISIMFYGSGGSVKKPKFQKVWEDSDLLAGDFLFMRKYLPEDLKGKTIVTNTTTEENREFLKKRGVRRIITSTPSYDGRSFGTNLMEAALTAYAAKKRPLSDLELNTLIDELPLMPNVITFS